MAANSLGASARHVGRVGALAFALGVGMGLAAVPAVAVAEPDTAGNAQPDESSVSTGPARVSTPVRSRGGGARSGDDAAPAKRRPAGSARVAESPTPRGLRVNKPPVVDTVTPAAASL